MAKILWIGVGAAAVYLLTRRTPAPIVVSPALPTLTPEPAEPAQAGPIVSAGPPLPGFGPSIELPGTAFAPPSSSPNSVPGDYLVRSQGGYERAQQLASSLGGGTASPLYGGRGQEVTDFLVHLLHDPGLATVQETAHVIPGITSVQPNYIYTVA